MKVKRQPSANAKKSGAGGGQGAKKSDAFISRFAPALCFNFHPREVSTYLIGTEDCCVHRYECVCEGNGNAVFGFTSSPVF